MTYTRTTALVLLLVLCPARLFAAPAQGVQRTRFFAVQAGPVLLIVEEDRTTTGTNRSWQAEEVVENGESLTSGSFGPEDFPATKTEFRFTGGDYNVACSLLPKRNT